MDLLGPWERTWRGDPASAVPDFRASGEDWRLVASVTFEAWHPDPDGTTALLDEFVRVEASSWKLEPSALAARPHMEAFFREVSRRFAARGEVRLCFLRCGGRAVAAQTRAAIWRSDLGTEDRL